ncbi:MAG: hypothetical protein AB1713_10260 [Pseudomonadota bacterium]
MNPSQILNIILALTALAVLIGAGLIGYGWRGAMCGEATAKREAAAKESQLAAVVRAIHQSEALRAEDASVLSASAAERIKVIKETRYVEREAPRVATPHCADLGADWLRLFNRAIDAGHGETVGAGAAASSARPFADGARDEQ